LTPVLLAAALVCSGLCFSVTFVAFDPRN